jgi:hypothetical protein
MDFPGVIYILPFLKGADRAIGKKAGKAHLDQ